MRGVVLSAALAAVAAVAGCSGDDGGSSGAGASGGASGSGGAGGVSTSGSGGAGGAAQGGGGGGAAACDGLAADVGAKLAAARACTGASNQECQSFVAGMCCSEVVRDKDAPETQAYLDALDAFEQAGCAADCPAVPCQATNQGLCSAGACIPFQN